MRSRNTSLTNFKAPVPVLLLALVWGASAWAGEEQTPGQTTPSAGGPKGRITGSLTFSRRRPKQPIVVYIDTVEKGKGTLAMASPSEKLVIRQKGAAFRPAFAVIVKGQQVEFLNDEEENIDHNVYFLGVEKTDLGSTSKGKSMSHPFRTTGRVSMHCSIHKLMDGKLFVVPFPAYALVPGNASTFTIDDVPAGRYRLKTFQKTRRFRDADIAVEVTPGGVTTVKLELKR